MKLTVLGSSHGVPSETRFSSGYMLEVGENIYLFDGGAPLADLLLRKGKSFTNVKAFFNSHFHSDHISGATNMVALCCWYYTESDIDVFLTSENNKKIFADFVSASADIKIPEERVRLSVISGGVIFDDGTVRVTAIPTKHSCMGGAFAFFIECEGKSILYTGDMTYELDDFPQIAFERFIDLIITECAHFPLQTLEERMTRMKTNTLVISHVYPVSKIDEINLIKDKYDFEIQAAEDDDIYEI